MVISSTTEFTCLIDIFLLSKLIFLFPFEKNGNTLKMRNANFFSSVIFIFKRNLGEIFTLCLMSEAKTKTEKQLSTVRLLSQ